MTAPVPPDQHALESALNRWGDAVLAAAIFAIDPQRLGGIAVRSQCGPVRDSWNAFFKTVLPPTMPFRRVPIDVTESRLIGGMDLAATLASGHAVAERGLLAQADGGVLVLTSAERADKMVLAALACVLDDGVVRVERDAITAVNSARVGVIAFDESRDDEPPIAALLSDRLTMHINLDAIPVSVAEAGDGLHDQIASARPMIDRVTISDRDIEALCGLSLALGVASLRAPLHAARVAQASAALNARTAVAADDLELALRLTLVPRATQIPSENNDDQQQAPPEQSSPPDAQADAADTNPSDAELQEMLLAAAKAALPPGLLENLKRAAELRKSKFQSGRAGTIKIARTVRGRRAGTRRGDPRAGGSLDLLATVRAAAPWQIARKRERSQRIGKLVNRSPAQAPRLEVRRDDFRLRRFKHQSETATIFVVDASGSAAIHRLAEAKGAVELLLADCYARRDHVALIAFRGKRAELLLPPTRSLVRAKRSLAGLPGGGGTPLATATDEACSLGRAVLRKGQSPTLVFLTDGRANINRNGQAGRPIAESDALAAARTLKAEGLAAIVIDTSQHAGKESRAFADAMGATYLPLPHADASSLSTAIRHAAG